MLEDLQSRLAHLEQQIEQMHHQYDQLQTQIEDLRQLQALAETGGDDD